MTAVVWHLLRGLAAAALVALALASAGGASWTALLFLAAAALLLRGCPMCWLLGLAERLRTLSPQRG